AVLFVIFAVIFGESTTNEDGSTGFYVRLSGLPAVSYLVLSFGYYTVLEGTTGQTLGKMAMGLRVTGPAGEAIGLGKSAIRNLLRIVDFLPFFYLVGFICAVASKQKQRIGDMAAGSYVVAASQAVASSTDHCIDGGRT